MTLISETVTIIFWTYNMPVVNVLSEMWITLPMDRRWVSQKPLVEQTEESPTCISLWITFPVSLKAPEGSWLFTSQFTARFITLSSMNVNGLASEKDFTTKAVNLQKRTKWIFREGNIRFWLLELVLSHILFVCCLVKGMDVVALVFHSIVWIVRST